MCFLICLSYLTIYFVWSHKQKGLQTISFHRRYHTLSYKSHMRCIMVHMFVYISYAKRRMSHVNHGWAKKCSKENALTHHNNCSYIPALTLDIKRLSDARRTTCRNCTLAQATTYSYKKPFMMKNCTSKEVNFFVFTPDLFFLIAW